MVVHLLMQSLDTRLLRRALNFVLVAMTTKVDLLLERSVAELARKWSETFVLPTVGDQVRRLAERLAAEPALVGLFPGMHEHVLLHVGLLVEALVAKFAREPAFARVDEQMRRERGAALERLATIPALVGLRVRVHDHVLLQAYRLGKNLVAYVA